MQDATADEDDSPAIDETSLDTEGKNPNPLALGRLGGKKGGQARVEKLTPEQRSDIPRRAAQARWGNR